MLGFLSNSADPEVILDKALTRTYGKIGQLNIFTQDQKATVDSFKCYWQIDHMVQNRTFGHFPLIESIPIKIKHSEEGGMEDNGGRQDLKNLYEIPQIFKVPEISVPDPTQAKTAGDPKEEKSWKLYELKGYKFFIPHNYHKNKKN